MEWGLYVELPNTIEGLVHVNTLTDDYYIFDREHYSLTGESKKRQYIMGQKIKVRVENADIVTKTVDFSPVTRGKPGNGGRKGIKLWEKNQGFV